MLWLVVLSGEPFDSDITLTYLDLDYTREWGGKMILQVQVHVGDYVPMVTFLVLMAVLKSGRTFDPMPWDSYATIQPVIQILGDLVPHCC